MAFEYTPSPLLKEFERQMKSEASSTQGAYSAEPAQAYTTPSAGHPLDPHLAAISADTGLSRNPFIGERADVIDLLPTEAQGALTALREHVWSLRLQIEDLSKRKQDAWAEHEHAKGNYAVLTNGDAASRNGRSRIYGEDHPLALDAKASLDKADRILRDLTGRYDETSEKWQRHNRLQTSVERYIAAAGKLKVAPTAKLKLPSADVLASEVARVRKDLAELQADRHAITSAAWPAAEAKAQARAEIEQLAELGKPRVTQMIDLGPQEGLIWPNVVGRSRSFGMNTPLAGDGGHAGHDIPGGHLAMAAYLFKDTLIKAVEAEIDAHAEDDAALSAEQRAAKLADCEDRILAAEHVEIALIRKANGTIDFRDDTDPRAFLGVDGPKPRED